METCSGVLMAIYIRFGKMGSLGPWSRIINMPPNFIHSPLPLGTQTFWTLESSNLYDPSEKISTPFPECPRQTRKNIAVKK
jgi:hypothetical protein